MTLSTGLSKSNDNAARKFFSVWSSQLALSPLFIYYVERCVVMKQPITADGGAYMVAIPETFQGLSNNRGTGTPLTLTINNTKYTFAGAMRIFILIPPRFSFIYAIATAGYCYFKCWEF